MMMLGNDPGTTNSGYTVLNITKKALTILEIGMIESTFKNMTDQVQYKKLTKAERVKLAKQGIKRPGKEHQLSYPAFSDGFATYYNCVNKLLDDYPDIKCMVAERFQTRGNMGPLIEMVSMQLGTNATLCYQRGIQFRLVVASQWKNEINRIIVLEDIYEYAKQFGLTPHECDSTGMALYQAAYLGIMPLEISLLKWRSAIAKWSKLQ
jgi:hypothetical protein